MPLLCSVSQSGSMETYPRLDKGEQFRPGRWPLLFDQKPGARSSYDEALAQLQQLKAQLAEEALDEPKTESGVLSIAIDIGNGQEETIEVSKDDNPELLASMFCVKHGLNERQRVKLARLIEKNLAETMSETQPQPEVVSPSIFPRSNSCVPQKPATTLTQPCRETPERISSPVSNADFNNWQREIEKNLKDRRKSNKGPKINAMSERIVARRSRSGVPAYLRLHQQALTKQRTQREQRQRLNQSAVLPRFGNTTGTKSLNASMVQNRKNPDVCEELNFGVRMYERSKQEREEQSRQWVRLKSEKEKRELQDATFHPEINSMSKSLARSRSCNKPEQRLIQLGTIRQEKIKHEQNMQLLYDKLQCPFRPQINRRSQDLARGRYGNASVDLGVRRQDEFVRLFTDAKRRKDEREKSAFSAHKECTFFPNTTLTKDYKPLDESLQRPFLDRMAAEERRTQRVAKAGSSRGWNHKPVTGRPPRTERNTACLPIGDYLYSQSKVNEETRVKRKEAEEGRRKGQSVSLIKEESRKLVENMKTASYQKLFTMLDSDEDGLLTAKDVDISFVATDVLTLITPVLCDMETEGTCMRYADFVRALDRLYSGMTIPEKKVLLNFARVQRRREGETLTQFNFRPEISNKSKELVARSPLAGLGLPERAARAERLKQARLEEQVRNRETEQLVGCTFHPLLLNKKRAVATCTLSNKGNDELRLEGELEVNL